ncbi:hypothetical protein C8R44DRAFT_752750 [Mycena epipterygia]|nr:hypothetical protein C8R44DRAFT_752750 [Mycena epipterygia]
MQTNWGGEANTGCDDLSPCATLGALSVDAARCEHVSHVACTAVHVPFGVYEIGTLVAIMLQTLDYLQQQHITHRDLHSDSWLLNSQGVLKLTEFSNPVLVKSETPLSTDPAGVVYCRLHVGAKHIQCPSSMNVGSAAATKWYGVRGRSVTARSGNPVEVGGYDLHHPIPRQRGHAFLSQKKPQANPTSGGSPGVGVDTFAGQGGDAQPSRDPHRKQGRRGVLCHYSDLSTTESTGRAVVDFWSSGERGYASRKRVCVSELPTLGRWPSRDHQSLGNLDCKTSDNPPSPWTHGRIFDSSFGGPA